MNLRSLNETHWDIAFHGFSKAPLKTTIGSDSIDIKAIYANNNLISPCKYAQCGYIFDIHSFVINSFLI